MFDLVINNGNILDPLDGEYRGNIGIASGRIDKVSKEKLRGKKEINADGKKVSPGFIDIHIHEDPLDGDHIKYEVFNYMALMGVTTALGGNCGIGNLDVSKYLDVIDRNGSPINYAGLVGIAEAREEVGCKDRYKPATKEEIKKIINTVAVQLDKGALGISFGLEYAPGTSTEEIIQICHEVRKFPNKLVSCHYRFDALRSLEALAEMIIVVRETKVKFQVSHIGSCAAFGQIEPALNMLNAAFDGGVNVMADVYPYSAFCSFVGSAVFDPGCFERWRTSYDAIMATEGKYKGQRCDKEIFDYLRENEPDTLVVAFVMNEEEVVEAIKHPLTMIASDAIMHDRQGHPRAAGCFPRVLGRYVRQREDISLIKAIDKMTNMPAQRIGLKTKGRIKEGFDADITIFDYDKIIDNATFESPSEPPSGIDCVIVNGIEVVENGQLTGQRPGIGIRI